jgi:uncharacterized protein YjeT (DUF2065 family)
MSDLIVGIGLVLVIEGLVYAAAPGAMRRMAERLPELSDQTLRTGGLLALAAGVLVVWLARA